MLPPRLHSEKTLTSRIFFQQRKYCPVCACASAKRQIKSLQCRFQYRARPPENAHWRSDRFPSCLPSSRSQPHTQELRHSAYLKGTQAETRGKDPPYAASAPEAAISSRPGRKAGALGRLARSRRGADPGCPQSIAPRSPGTGSGRSPDAPHRTRVPPLSLFSAGGRQPPAPCLSAPQAAPPRLPPVYLGAGPGGCGSPRALTSLPSARCPPLRSGPWRAARPEGSRDAAGASCPLCRPDRTGTGMGMGRGTETGLPSTARSRPGSALPGR